MKKHTVIQGESILTLAHLYGVSWQSIWDHPDNTNLKNKRHEPAVLLPGDLVMIPDKKEMLRSANTHKINKFQYSPKPAPVYISLVLTDADDQILTNTEYIIKYNDTQKEGKTDSNGILNERIPADINEVILEVNNTEIILKTGQMDPLDTVAGLQKRLENLGYSPGDIDGDQGEYTKSALSSFQSDNGLEISGEYDDATKGKLKTIYGI